MGLQRVGYDRVINTHAVFPKTLAAKIMVPKKSSYTVSPSQKYTVLKKLLSSFNLSTERKIYNVRAVF